MALRPVRSRRNSLLRWLAALTAALLTACAGPTAPQATRLEVTPGGVLLTIDSPNETLAAAVFDASGQPLDLPVTWSSSDPGVISIDADGNVTALASVGSAKITARAGGAQTSVLAVVAELAAGAVLVADEALIGEPQAVDPNAEFGLGFQYTVTVATAPPAIGTILVASGAAPVAGRVVAIDGNTVTLEMVAIDEVFAKLDIDQTFDLAEAAFVTPPAVSQHFDVATARDGVVQLTLKPGPGLSSPESVGTQATLGAQATFGAPPFRCETALSAVQIDLARAELNFTPDLSLDVVWNDTQRKLVVSGAPKVDLKVTPRVAAAIEGKVTCEFTFREIQLPIPGPLGLFLGAVIPIGAGFEVEGKLPIAEFGVEVSAEVGATARFGFDCNPECSAVTELDTLLDGDVKPLLPTAFPGVKLEASVYAFLFAKLEGGARFSSTLRIEAIEASAGVKLAGKFADEATQAADDAFRSEYGLSFEASIGAGSGLTRFLDLIKVTLAKLELKLVVPLDSSPTGTLTADREEFSAGDTVTFTIDLAADNVDFHVLGYNVEAVRVYRITAQSLLLANEVTASPNQTQFEIPWVATVDGTATGNFIAFAATKALPPLRLELGKATAQPAGTGLLTFSFVDDQHIEESTENSTRVSDEAYLETANFTLRQVSDTGSLVTFEVSGGTVSNSQQVDSVRHIFDQVVGACEFERTIEEHATQAGSGTHTGGFVTVAFGPGDAYTITDSAGATVLSTGTWTIDTDNQVNAGPADCAGPDSFETIDLSDDVTITLGEVSGTVDFSNPRVLSGTILDDDGSQPSPTVLSWTLTLP